MGSKCSGRNASCAPIYTCNKSENETLSIMTVLLMTAEDKSAGSEAVTPEPVKGVAESEEARPLPLIMSHANNNKPKKYIDRHLAAK